MAPERFATFAACVARLERPYLEDRKPHDAAPVDVDATTTRLRLFESDGIRHPAQAVAVYEGMRGVQFRRVLADSASLETNYSYDSVHYICRGRTLSGETARGAYRPDYAPLTPASKP